MGGHHEGHAVELFGEITSHRNVPGMRVDDVDSLERFDLGKVEAQGFEGSLELAFGAVGDLGPGLGAADVEIAVVRVLRTPAMHLDLDLAG